MGGKVNGFIPNPTFDPIIVPGCLDPLFRGQIPEGVDPRTLMQVEPLGRAPRVPGPRRAPAGDGRAGPRRRAPLPDLRLRRRAGPEGRHPGHDGDACRPSTAGSRRTGASPTRAGSSAPPCSRFADVDAAVAEVESLLERGVRIIHVRPAPVPAGNGTSRSLGDKQHDPVWARIAEAGVPVAFHLGDSGYEASFALGVGQPGRLRLRQERPARRRAHRGPGDPRRHRLARRPRRVHSATRRCGSPASRTARTGSACS